MSPEPPQVGDPSPLRDPARPSRPRRAAAQIVLLGAFALDYVLYSLVIPFLPHEALALGATPLATGILFAMYSMGLLLATPLAAGLTDRLGPRRTLLWGLVALAGSTLAFAFAPSLLLGLPGLIAARIAQGVASAITWTAGLAVLAHLYQPAERPRIFARAFTATGLAALIGPPLGAVLYSWGGFILPFLVATGLVALDGIGRLIFLPNNSALAAAPTERGATRMLFRDGSFRMGLFAVLVGALALSALEPITPLVLGGPYGLPTWAIGAAFGGIALCFVLVQPAVSRREQRHGTPRTVRGGLAFYVLALAAITVVGTVFPDARLRDLVPSLVPLVAVLALLVIVGCALAFVLIPAPEWLTQRGQRLASIAAASRQAAEPQSIEEADSEGKGDGFRASQASQASPYGAIYGAYNGAYALGTLLGPLAAGAAMTVQDVVHSYLILAGVSALGALVLLGWRERGAPGKKEPQDKPTSAEVSAPASPSILPADTSLSSEPSFPPASSPLPDTPS